MTRSPQSSPLGGGGPRSGGGGWTPQVRDRIADAIRDHYKPQGPADTVPTAPVTVAVALADKLDTLVGFFAIDEKPTGSKDPFALRRAALGVIRLVLENGVRIELRQFVGLKFVHAWLDALTRELRAGDQAAMRIAADAGLNILELTEANEHARAERTKALAPRMMSSSEGKPEVAVRLDNFLAFFADRLTVLLRDRGQRHDLVAAVFAPIAGKADDDLVRIVRRVEALAAFLATDDGANLLAGYKRASNILRAEEKKGPVPTGMVQTGLANQPEAETVLAFAVNAARTAVETALETEDFAAAMTALAALRAPVDAFFEAVMVNSDVPEERDNRLKLLGQVRDVMGQVADFGQIAG